MQLNKKVYGAACLAIIASGSALVWSGRGGEAPAPPVRRAFDASDKAFPAGFRGSSTGAVAATGRVEAWREAVIRAKGLGRLVAYAKKEGDWVGFGETVAILDQEMERSSLREAEAELFRYQSGFNRLKLLHVQKVISDQEFDDADAALRLALARRDKARAVLEERTLRAPFPGRVLKTYLEAGESLPPGLDAPLFVIGDTRRLKVRAEIDEQDIGRLAAGAPAEVRADAYSGEVFSGRVCAVSGILGRKTMRSDDPRERMDAKVLEATIELAPSNRLKPGVTVEIKIAEKMP